ncbi:MAG: hypothetical protein JKY90_00215 [Gammaproteobacteria bacterium]|nr:hypothetical protein [Gammaproteobacteria bacterium]
MTKKTDTTTTSEKTSKPVKKTAKKSTSKTTISAATVKKELEKTQSQLHDLQDDNAHLKEKLTQLEEELEGKTSHRVDDERSWDEKVIQGLCRIVRAWSDYGPVIIIVLLALMVVAWIVSWGGLFKLCFTLLMAWLFSVSLGLAKSQIKNRYDEALYQIRKKG